MSEPILLIGEVRPSYKQELIIEEASPSYKLEVEIIRTGAPGPKGDPGEPGPQGPIGLTGATGPAGSNGISAYEEAVAQGFIGTEEDWILSLKGDKGEKGDKGDAGVPQWYTHSQIAPSDSWTVVHNLGKMPSVTIVDTAETVIYGDILFIDLNTIRIDLNYSISGKVYCT